MTFRKILCPVDFSEPSREAMKVAAGLAAESNAELTLVHVWQWPIRMSEVNLMQSSLLEHERKQMEVALDGWKSEVEALGAKPVSVKVLTGVPWKTIVDEIAEEPRYDLVVMGTHGRTGIKRVLLGSVAERVARHADCPVFLARTRAAA